MFKKNKKIGALVIGLSIIGIVSVGLNSSFTYQAGHADFPAPQRPDLAYNIGDTPAPADNKGDGGGIISNKSVSDPGTGSPSYAVHGDPGGHIVSNESHGDSPAPANNKGDGGAPAYGHGEPWGVADGDTGSHADLPTSADGNHGGSPSYEHDDTPAPQA